MASPNVSLLRRVNQRFGRVGPSRAGVAAYLGDTTAPPAPPVTPAQTAPACGYLDFVKAAPLDAAGKPKMTNGTRETLIGGAAVAVGAGVGAAAVTNSRVLGGVLGGALGAALATANLVREFRAWKTAQGCGGPVQTPLAPGQLPPSVDTTPQPGPDTQVTPGSVGPGSPPGGSVTLPPPVAPIGPAAKPGSV